jgi:hypothetical protein
MTKRILSNFIDIETKRTRLENNVARRKLPIYPTLVYFDWSSNLFQGADLIFLSMVLDEENFQITGFIPESGVALKNLTNVSFDPLDDVPLKHLSNHISITNNHQRYFLVDVNEILHDVDIAIRSTIPFLVICDIILGYFNIWNMAPIRKQCQASICKLPQDIQWWFVPDDEELKSPKDTLLQWISEDKKLYQLVEKITKFDVFSDDHQCYTNSRGLKNVLVVQRQDFDLVFGKWVSRKRINDEKCCMHDNSWCSLEVRCKNSLYIDDGLLHFSIWSTGSQLSQRDIEELRKSCQVTHCVYLGFYKPSLEREVNLIFTLDELREITRAFPLITLKIK